MQCQFFTIWELEKGQDKPIAATLALEWKMVKIMMSQSQKKQSEIWYHFIQRLMEKVEFE